MWNEEWAYKHFFMLCNFFHINKKVLCISKFVIEKQTTVLFFFFCCSSVYWTWELDWCPGVAKKWWWVNKAWQVWFLWCFVTSSLFIVARPMICFFLVYGSLLNLARTMIPFFAFRQITTDWLVFKIVLALVLDFLTTDPVWSLVRTEFGTTKYLSRTCCSLTLFTSAQGQSVLFGWGHETISLVSCYFS